MIVIFAGPSIKDEDRALLEARYLPPAAQGDVYKATRGGAKVIALIDGFFDNVASVWHKEVLWALQCGVHVFGAASMGALRAAELHQFGMVGIGSIFEAYRDGILEDDDEVAVLHGDASSQYAPLSDAMVDIRCTVARATEFGVLSPGTGERIIKAAKGCHYRDRRLLEIVALLDLPKDEEREFTQWLTRHGRSQKRKDAVTLLKHISSHCGSLEQPFRPAFRFEPTVMWHEFLSTFGETTPVDAGDPHAALTLEDLLDEVRLQMMGDDIMGAALNRFMLVREHNRSGYAIDRATVESALERFRREHQLLRAADFDHWRQESGLSDRSDIARFFNDQARAYGARDRLQPSAQQYIVDILRERGMYGRVIRRAKAKQHAMSAIRVERSNEAIKGAMQTALQWFKARGYQCEDSRRMGFGNHESFLVAIWKEYEFTRSSAYPEYLEAEDEKGVDAR